MTLAPMIKSKIFTPKIGTNNNVLGTRVTVIIVLAIHLTRRVMERFSTHCRSGGPKIR